MIGSLLWDSGTEIRFKRAVESGITAVVEIAAGGILSIM